MKSNMKNFKSYEGYRRWLAFGHIRTKTGLVVKEKAGRKNLFDATPGNQKISIRGKPIKVVHAKAERGY